MGAPCRQIWLVRVRRAWIGPAASAPPRTCRGVSAARMAVAEADGRHAPGGWSGAATGDAAARVRATVLDSHDLGHRAREVHALAESHGNWMRLRQG